MTKDNIYKSIKLDHLVNIDSLSNKSYYFSKYFNTRGDYTSNNKYLTTYTTFKLINTDI